ncbi:MAG: hypothetical protein HY298_09425 [Verrucomicrobia bacterium]|nr:hypothetical protein [Verrucomicrobiota bacterium]
MKIAALILLVPLVVWWALILKVYFFPHRRRKPVPIPVLGGKLCAICLAGYNTDKKKAEFEAAIANFLSLDATALKEAEGYVFQYYKDYEKDWKTYDDEFKPIKSPSDIWTHVQFGSEPTVSRRRNGDKGIYISLECGCDWEEEHGMQIVFKNGLKVVKVGPYDGHLTNSDAYADDSLENVVYKA